MGALIKVVKVKKIVDALIQYVRNDYETHPIEEETFLYRLLSENQEGDYNFFTQAKEIFLRDDKNPRNIRTSLMFNKNTNGSPHIHIRESVRPKGTFNSIGGIEGSINVFDDGTFGENYRDTKRATYEILITSLNALDTILISEVIYTLMYGAYETLANEFSLFEFSLKELVFQDNSAANLYVKAIGLDTQQENIIPSIITNDILDSINFEASGINGELIIPTPLTYQVTMSKIGNGTIYPAAGTTTEDVNTIFLMHAIPDIGWVFVRWDINSRVVLDSFTYEKIRSDYTIEAVFAIE